MNITPKQLEQRVLNWQKRLSGLGVGHFRVDEVSVTNDVPGKLFSHAGVSVATDYDSCRFAFNKDYVSGASERDIDETILHEWVHVSMRDLNNATDLARPWLPEAAWDTFDDNLEHAKESLTDRLARALYALYTR